MSATKLFTAADLLAMGSDAPFELIEGELRPVSPSNLKSSIIAAQLSRRIGQFSHDHGLGKVSGESGGVLLRANPDTLVAPDVAFFPTDRLHRIPDSGYSDVLPRLVVEVLSPTDVLTEVEDKARRYLEAGVDVVWIVIPIRLSVIVYEGLDSVRILGSNMTLTAESILPGFSLLVAEIFQ